MLCSKEGAARIDCEGEAWVARCGWQWTGELAMNWSSDYGDILLHVGKMGKKFTMVGTVIRRKIWKQKKCQFWGAPEGSRRIRAKKMHWMLCSRGPSSISKARWQFKRRGVQAVCMGPWVQMSLLMLRSWKSSAYVYCWCHLLTWWKGRTKMILEYRHPRSQGSWKERRESWRVDIRRRVKDTSFETAVQLGGSNI